MKGEGGPELCCLVLRGMEASQLPGGEGGRVSFGVGCETVHFLSVLAGTYDDTVRNIDIDRAGYLRHSFIAGFPTERVPKMPLSGVSTRSGDLARFTFKAARRHDDGCVHPPDSLSAGDALWHRCLRA